jgi:hypothetical protein
MRRPHTSAGPRDKSYGLGNGYAAQVQPDDDERHKSLLLSPEPETTVAARGFSKNTGAFGQKWLVSPRLGTSASGGSASGHDAKVREVVNRKGKGRDVMNGMEVRAWEEELQRIESESRRSTASMFGFAFKRKRITEQGFDRRPVVGRGAS